MALWGLKILIGALYKYLNLLCTGYFFDFKGVTIPCWSSSILNVSRRVLLSLVVLVFLSAITRNGGVKLVPSNGARNAGLVCLDVYKKIHKRTDIPL